MSKKYTKKQITEAISYWQRKLDESAQSKMVVDELEKDIQQWKRDDVNWGKAKVIINTPDGSSYYATYTGTSDVLGGVYFIECGDAVFQRPAKRKQS